MSSLGLGSLTCLYLARHIMRHQRLCNLPCLQYLVELGTFLPRWHSARAQDAERVCSEHTQSCDPSQSCPCGFSSPPESPKHCLALASLPGHPDPCCSPCAHHIPWASVLLQPWGCSVTLAVQRGCGISVLDSLLRAQRADLDADFFC